MTKDTDDRTVTAEQVLKFLADNPDFLAGLSQQIPTSETDSKIIDLTPAIAKKARSEARKIGQQKKSIISLATENMVNWKRLHHAALALLAAQNANQLFHVIAEEFPPIFDLSSCYLITASPVMYDLAARDRAILCTDKTLAEITAGNTLTLGTPAQAIKALIDCAPQSCAIVALPDQLAAPVAQTILVLGGKTDTSFTPDLANDLLILLAEMVGVALTACLERTSAETN
jgi:uncharacterized protein YigA (DUF484 family)